MLASLDSAVRPLEPLRVSFGGDVKSPVFIQTPWLAGSRMEDLFDRTTRLPASDGIALYRSEGLLIGHAYEPFVAAELAARSESLYRRILAAAQGRHLYRVWNYVPQINAETGGFENYRAFSAGRAQAFEAVQGCDFPARLPAASAVGCEGSRLDAIFIAGETAPTHFENPEQIPAYQYPPEHGPRSPSFARATVADDGSRRWTFISGTAAIKGHQTIAAGDLAAQLDCTLDNLRLISQATGLGENLAAGRASRRHFKVYLRHPGDLAAAQARLARDFFRPTDEVTYLHAAICRAALAVEIEATLVTGR
ncbi:MAG TPA: hypothetical protein VGE76_21970 [Opitutaceae bacterium]